MIALINAALDYKRGFDRLTEIINANATRAATNPEAGAPLLIDMQSMATSTVMLDHPEQTKMTLALEYNHFRRNSRRNDRTARRLALKRREAGIFPRSTTSREARLENAADLPMPLVRPQFAPFTGLSQQQRSEIDAISAKLEGIDRELTPTEVYEMKRQIAAAPITDTCPYCSATNAANCRTSPCRWLAEITERERAEAAEADATDFDDSQ